MIDVAVHVRTVIHGVVAAIVGQAVYQAVSPHAGGELERCHRVTSAADVDQVEVASVGAPELAPAGVPGDCAHRHGVVDSVDDSLAGYQRPRPIAGRGCHDV